MMKELTVSQLTHVTGGELENVGNCHCICKSPSKPKFRKPIPIPKPIEPPKVMM